MFETNLTEMENLTIEHLPTIINGTLNNTQPVNLTIPDNMTVVITYAPYMDLYLGLLIVIAMTGIVSIFLTLLLLVRRSGRLIL